MAAVMLSLRKNLQKPDRAFQCSPSFFSSTCILAASLLDANHALPFLSSSSSISCYLPCPPSCRHLAEHQRRPPTFPVLSFFPFSLLAHHHHPSSPALPLFSASSPHPTALSPPQHCRLLPPSLPHLHRRLLPPSWSIPLPPPLSLLCCLLRLPEILLWVISASARTSMASKLIALDPPPPFIHSLSLFSPSASAPSSLIDAAAVASFTVAPPPPTKTSCHRRLLYSSSTDVVAASLFLHRCPTSPPATQEDPRPPAPPPLLVFASVRCHGLEPEMGIG